MLLQYLGKLKIQVICRYSADMEENANKLHFECTGRSAKLSGEATKNTFSSIKKKKSVADNGNF